MRKRIRISWDEFRKDCDTLADLVKLAEMDDSAILAVANGGLFVAGMIGRILRNDDIAVIGVKRKAPLGAEKTEYVVDITSSFICRYFVERAHHKILLVDDIYDSGSTLKVVHDHLLKHSVFNEKDLKIMYATPYFKSGKLQNSTSVNECLISPLMIGYLYWVEYPWESEGYKRKVI